MVVVHIVTLDIHLFYTFASASQEIRRFWFSVCQHGDLLATYKIMIPIDMYSMNQGQGAIGTITHNEVWDTTRFGNKYTKILPISSLHD